MSNVEVEDKMNENKEEMRQKAEQLKQKMNEMQDKLSEGVNNAMENTASSLEKAAENLHKTAEFLKGKNADTIKEDFSVLVKKYPGKMLVGSVILGFLFGKIITR